MASLTTKKALLFIFLIGTIVFGNGLFNQFIGDDYGQIVENISVHSLNNLLTVFKTGTFYLAGTSVGNFYRPMVQAYNILIYSIFGPTPFWFHLFQLLIHITNAGILFLLLKRFLKEKTSLFLAIIFLIHPINSESILGIAATQEVLFFGFGILATYLLVTYGGKKMGIAAFLLLLSLFSKESGILFVVITVAYLYLFNQPNKLKHLLQIILVTIPYYILKINAVGLIGNPENSPIDRLNIGQRLINIPKIIWFYIQTFFYPVNLSNGYHWLVLNINLRDFWLPLVLILAVISIIVIFAKKLAGKYPKYFKGYLFFVGILFFGLALHLQVIPLDMTVSERWFYFPMAGLLGIMGIVYETQLSRVNKIIIYSAGLLIIILLGTRSFIRTFDWRDQVTLYYHDLKTSPEDYSSLSYLGSVLLKEGKIEEAMAYTNRSIEIFPYCTNYNVLGSIYVNQKDYAKAKEAYLNGIKYVSNCYPSYSNLSGLSLIYGDIDENILFVKKSIQKFPQSSRLWTILAILEYSNKNIDGAKSAIYQAYNLDKSDQILQIGKIIYNNQPLNLKPEYE